MTVSFMGRLGYTAAAVRPERLLVYPDVENRIDRLLQHTDRRSLEGRRIGLEKESLRVGRSGAISQSDHPLPLGSALCNRTITTDFSEALLEMVTPPLASAREAVGYLTDLHRFIVSRLPAGEHLWNASMPCVLRGAESIRIGEYGSSHNARMKHAYRRGLALRYGKRMQAIAGIHFNFSLPDEAWALWRSLQKDSAAFSGLDATQLSTRGYFHMTRNLLRIGWLVPYLFGDSPAICQSFLGDKVESDLATFNSSTRLAELGTSLRMGDIGYQYRQDGAIDLSVRHDDFERYLADLFGHVTSEHPPYRALGVFDADGQHQQLNARRLQIENEYYSSVRPKQIPEPGEMPILALQRRGIRYLELRSIDIGLGEPAGISAEQVAMLEMLMLFAWLADSPALAQDEMVLTGGNMKKVAQQGRTPDLLLDRPQGQMSLRDWGLQVVDALRPLAVMLDELLETRGEPVLYSASLETQRAKLLDPELTPSASQLRDVRQHGSFFECVMSRSRAHHKQLMTDGLPVETEQALEAIVARSVEQQAELEANTEGSFEDFLSDYFAQLSNPPTVAGTPAG